MELAYGISDLMSLIFVLCIAAYIISERLLYENERRKRFLSLLVFTCIFLCYSLFMDAFMAFGMDAEPEVHLAVYSIYWILTQALASWFIYFIVTNIRGGERRNRKSALVVATGLFAFVLILLIVNLKTHSVFHSEGLEGIVVSPLFYVFFIILAVDVSCGVYLLFRDREHVQPQERRMLNYIPIFLFTLIVMQLAFPGIRFTSIIFAILVFFSFANLTSISFLTDSATGLGNLKTMISSLDWYFARDMEFSILQIHLADYDRLERDYARKSMDGIMASVADSLSTVKGIYQAFRISEDCFTVLCPPPSSAECRSISLEVSKIFERSLFESDDLLTVRAHIFLIPCPIVARTRTGVLNLISYFSSSRFEIASLPKSAYSRSGNHFDFIVCDLKLAEMLNRKRQLVALLKDAVKNGGFSVAWQPICDKNGHFTGRAECLIRLFDRQSGSYVRPDEFIPVAEAEGYIDYIANFTLAESCRTIRACMDRGLSVPILSINFSSRQVYSRVLMESVRTTIDRYGIDAHYIKIEITEDAIIENYRQVEAIMRDAQRLGIGFYLDDFGSGYASIPRYLNLPFECVKIDKSFVKAAAEDEKNDAFLRAVVPCFSALDFSVVFEGVEDKTLYEYTKSFDSDVDIQGYWYSPPVSTAQFHTLLGLNVVPKS